MRTTVPIPRTTVLARTPWTTVATPAADEEAYADATDLVAGHAYGYRLCAVNEFGDSPWSNRVSVVAQ